MKVAVMGENRDLGIKLFGRTIAQISDGHGCEVGKEAGESPHGDKSEKTPTPLTAGDFKDQQEDYNIQLTEEHENLLQKEGESETNTPGQEKVFKRPEKILPCPRCKSSDTKFCYFNNYNVNQPRHFCKNCQRYWTAGGTMRNVPIGAGRRKGKQFASQYRQMLASSDSLPPIRGDATEFVGQQFHMAGESKSSFRPPTGNEMVLKFGPDAPLCESMENALRLRDKEKCETVGSGNCGENGEEISSGSSITASSFKEADLKDKDQPNFRGPVTGLNLTPPPLPYTYHAPQWGFSWHPNWSMAPTIAPLRSSESIHVPEPTLPLQFVQASNWRCLPIYPVVSGNMILTASNSCTHSSPSTCDGAYNGNYLPALGKHSRDASLAEEERVEAGILVPKTLRVDDPYEASKSSIWSTLGIRADENDNAVRGLNVQGKEQGSDFIWVSEPNPAAVSCTRTFEEST